MTYTKFISLKTPSYMGRSAGDTEETKKGKTINRALPVRGRTRNADGIRSSSARAAEKEINKHTPRQAGAFFEKSVSRKQPDTAFGKAAAERKTGTAFEKTAGRQASAAAESALRDLRESKRRQTGAAVENPSGAASGSPLRERSQMGVAVEKPSGASSESSLRERSRTGASSEKPSGASSESSLRKRSRTGAASEKPSGAASESSLRKRSRTGAEKCRFSASKVCVFSLLTLAIFTSAVYFSGLCAPENFTKAFLTYCEKAEKAGKQFRTRAAALRGTEAGAFGESLYVRGLGGAGREGGSSVPVSDAGRGVSEKPEQLGGAESYAGSLLAQSSASNSKAGEKEASENAAASVLAASAYTGMTGTDDPSAVFFGDGAGAETEFSAESLPSVSDDDGIIGRDLSRGGDGIYLLNETGRNIDVVGLSASPLPEALRLYGTEEPEVLILHTHGTESYIDTGGRSTDTEKNVVRVGDELAEVLEAYGISVIHSRTMHDEISYITAYKSSKAEAQKLLASYPSIKYVIDLHRDALPKDGGARIKCVSDVHGNTAAQMMLVIGSDAGGGNHPNYTENLTAASRLQAEMNREFPTLMRPINLRSAVFNQDICRGAMILEVGCSDNTTEEALCAVRCFAKAFVRAGQGA